MGVYRDVTEEVYRGYRHHMGVYRDITEGVYRGYKDTTEVYRGYSQQGHSPQRLGECGHHAACAHRGSPSCSLSPQGSAEPHSHTARQPQS